MNMRISYLLVLVAFALGVAGSTAVASAETHSVYHGGSYFGDVVVERGQVVEGDINVVGGNATIQGTVDGDVNVVGGSIIMDGGTITGQQHALGGEVVESVVPWWAPSNFAGPRVGTDSRVWWRVTWDVLILVFFLIFPVRTRMAVGRLEQHPAIATAAGLFGWVAVIPLAILLAFTVVLIPLIFVEAVLLVAAVFVGSAALALLIGRRFYEMLSPRTTPSPTVALILGLALLTAAQLVPVLGIFVTLLALMIGLGAVVMTFMPESPATAAGPIPPRPTIGGPPMPVG
jgi:hypothetical protein